MRSQAALAFVATASVVVTIGCIVVRTGHKSTATSVEAAPLSGSARIVVTPIEPDADTSVDVFPNITENGMLLVFDHRTTTFRWQLNSSDPNADRSLKDADTTPAVDACIRVLVAAINRCHACGLGGRGSEGLDECWSTRAERCASANGVPDAALDACVKQVTAAPCTAYQQAAWQLPKGCDGYGLGDTEKWRGPQSAADEQRAKDQRCADRAAKWCKDERYVYGSRLIAADQQICNQGGCQYPGQAVLPDTFDDRSCRNRLTKLCQRGRAAFKVKPGRDPNAMFAWCVDIDNMDEWQCH